MQNKTIKNIFRAAGLFNIVGVLGLSCFFTNPFLAKYYPQVFSDFGLIAIMLWGLAYIAVADSWMKLRPLMFVFTLEKLVYVVSWIYFLVESGSLLPEIFDRSITTGLFLTGYGLGDLIFGCFFCWIGIKGRSMTE